MLDYILNKPLSFLVSSYLIHIVIQWFYRRRWGLIMFIKESSFITTETKTGTISKFTRGHEPDQQVSSLKYNHFVYNI